MLVEFCINCSAVFYDLDVDFLSIISVERLCCSMDLDTLFDTESALDCYQIHCWENYSYPKANSTQFGFWPTSKLLDEFPERRVTIDATPSFRGF